MKFWLHFDIFKGIYFSSQPIGAMESDTTAKGIDSSL